MAQRVERNQIYREYKQLKLEVELYIWAASFVEVLPLHEKIRERNLDKILKKSMSDANRKQFAKYLKIQRNLNRRWAKNQARLNKLIKLKLSLGPAYVLWKPGRRN